jgi:hypothetical protein
MDAAPRSLPCSPLLSSNGSGRVHPFLHFPTKSSLISSAIAAQPNLTGNSHLHHSFNPTIAPNGSAPTPKTPHEHLLPKNLVPPPMSLLSASFFPEELHKIAHLSNLYFPLVMCSKDSHHCHHPPSLRKKLKLETQIGDMQMRSSLIWKNETHPHHRGVELAR